MEEPNVVGDNGIIQIPAFVRYCLRHLTTPCCLRPPPFPSFTSYNSLRFLFLALVFFLLTLHCFLSLHPAQLVMSSQRYQRVRPLPSADPIAPAGTTANPGYDPNQN